MSFTEKAHPLRKEGRAETPGRKKYTLTVSLLFCVLTVLGFFLAGCTSGTDNPPGKFTVLVYMCGSNLETRDGEGTENIAEMLTAQLPEGTTALIQTGGARKWWDYDISAENISRYTLSGGELKLLETLPQKSMGQSDTLKDFLLYGIKQYPAEKMGLVLWNHGGGSIGGVCYDELHGNDALTLAELEEALDAARKARGSKLDLVGFDACLMATLDTAEAIAPHAKYMLASQELEPAGGWDYDTLLGAVAEDPDIDIPALGKVVCDGYQQKSARAGAEDFVTLSLVDLSKIDAVVSAFDALCADLTQNLSSQGSYPAVHAARHAEAYGGATEVEGYSNLVDGSGFADALSGGSKKAASLTDALADATIYSVSGSARAEAKGLSLFYPYNYDADSLTKYRELCEFKSYRTYLDKVYGNIPKKTVKFADAGSRASNGSFQMRLTKESAPYVASVDFLLLEVGGKEFSPTIKGLGQDNDIVASEDGLTHSSNFRGVWLALDGHQLSYSPIDEGEDYVVFTAPILLNGDQTNLRFSYTWDESKKSGGYYKTLGIWDGLGDGGISDKDIPPLEKGDKVTVLYNEINEGDYTSSLKEGETFTIGKNGGVISEQPLTQDNYQYVYKITDIFGNVFYSSTAVFEMKYTRAQLLKNPLPDGTYAADITVITDEVDNELVYGD